MKELFLLPEAYLDLEEAQEYYRERNERLAQEFVLAVEECLNDISEHPLQFQTIYKQNRNCNVRRFPYSVIYRIKKDIIAIKAIVHLKRHSRAWKNRKG